MPTTSEPVASSLQPTVQQQVSDALRDTSLPISQLLRLMWALDADQNAVNQNLRAQLRARIGAPITA